jgi:hypothetical protein
VFRQVFFFKGNYPTGIELFSAILAAFSLIVLGINANLLSLAAFHMGHHDDDDDDNGGSDRRRRMFGIEATGVAVAVLVSHCSLTLIFS